MSTPLEAVREVHSAPKESNSGEGRQKISLLEQRLACRALLAKQRQVIAHQIRPKLALTHQEASNSQYPRSATMRFLTQNPAPALGIFLRLATMVVGMRASGAINAGLQTYKMFKAGRRMFRE